MTAEGWGALRAGAWDDARSAFEAALADGETAAALDGLARARWWTGDPDGAMEHWERAYAAYRREGDDPAACRVALFLSKEYAEVRGNPSAANGWLARARDLLPEGASPERGRLLLAEADARPEAAEALRLAEEALSMGRELRDPDLELAALGRAGRAEIEVGRVEEGMTRFDQAMAAASSGEPEDLRTLGDLYCSLFLACELTLDVERFGQWEEVLMAFMERNQHPALLTFCGTCCAELFGAAGHIDDAEQQLLDTLRTLEATGQRARCVHPATRLASLRVLQGRLEEAEALLEGYGDLPEAVQPQVALYLARGQTALAAARIHRRLNEVGRDGLLGAPLLFLLAEVQVAQGDISGAVATAEAIADVGRRSGRERVVASADLAEGSALAATGDAAATPPLERAIERFARLEMPYWAARAHLELARALAGSEPERGIDEARQALAAFERLGANRDADEAAGFLRGLGVGGRTGPKGLRELSKREGEVLRLLGHGLTNAEIAARLYISTKTVATHIGNIFAKLQLRNRSEAAAYALRYLPEDVPTS